MTADRIARLVAEPPAECHLFLPDALDPTTPLLVCVHGISRNAEEHLSNFAPLAAAHGVAVLTPVFAPAPFPDYQRLGRQGRGLRADLVLRAMLDRLGEQCGLAPERIHLFGHSGGAQFVHRYAMAYPTQVARYVVSAAGWYTLPDCSLPYPFGTALDWNLPGIAFDPSAYLRVPGAVLVGTKDRRRGTTLRQAPFLDAAQGRTRIERAKHWVAAMNAAATARGLLPPLSFELVPGAGHRFGEMAVQGAAARAFNFLFGSERHT
ncbi:MAG TPA: hypothetical protein VFN42_09560 [Acetobacteraceae bacterium]|nr:hypothetical protein [Acetobacteraceae bacterium]